MMIKTVENLIERSVHNLSRWLGRTSALLTAVAIVLIWVMSRPYFESTESWQNAIMVTFSILTFLLIFLLQRSQNKDLLSIHLKLNEIVASQHGASNRLIDLENMPENEVHRLHRHYQNLAAKTKTEQNAGQIHTVEESNWNEENNHA